MDVKEIIFYIFKCLLSIMASLVYGLLTCLSILITDAIIGICERQEDGFFACIVGLIIIFFIMCVSYYVDEWLSEKKFFAICLLKYGTIVSSFFFIYSFGVDLIFLDNLYHEGILPTFVNIAMAIMLLAMITIKYIQNR